MQETRNELIKLARSRKTRTNQWTCSRPTDWRPGSVRNPDGVFDTHFTEGGAWELIATQLKAGCEVETVKLQKPPDKTAYVMNIDLGANEPMLYVKVQRGSGKIIARSFHYSKYPKKTGDKHGNK